MNENQGNDEGLPVEPPLPREFFFVDDRPYCLWSSQAAFDNEEFIKSLNAKFYGKIASQLGRRKLSNDRVRAEAGGIARIFWHQGIETFLTLVGSMVQAPKATHAYFTFCKNEDVRRIGRAYQSGERLPFEAVVLKDAGWDGLFGSVFSITRWFEDGITAEFFAKAIREMVADYLSDLHRLEYNSLKHGMRVNIGASRLEFKPTGSKSTESTFAIGSKDSSHLLAIKPVPAVSRKKARIHHQVERVTLGWSLERTIRDLSVLSMAMENVRNLLRHALGTSPTTLKFFRPSMDDDDRKDYFAQRPELANFVMRETFTLNEARLETEDQIRSAFQVIARSGPRREVEEQGGDKAV